MGIKHQKIINRLKKELSIYDYDLLIKEMIKEESLYQFFNIFSQFLIDNDIVFRYVDNLKWWMFILPTKKLETKHYKFYYKKFKGVCYLVKGELKNGHKTFTKN